MYRPYMCVSLNGVGTGKKRRTKAKREATKEAEGKDVSQLAADAEAPITVEDQPVEATPKRKRKVSYSSCIYFVSI